MKEHLEKDISNEYNKFLKKKNANASVWTRDPSILYVKYTAIDPWFNSISPGALRKPGDGWETARKEARGGRTYRKSLETARRVYALAI